MYTQKAGQGKCEAQGGDNKQAEGYEPPRDIHGRTLPCYTSRFNHRERGQTTHAPGLSASMQPEIGRGGQGQNGLCQFKLHYYQKEKSGQEARDWRLPLQPIEQIYAYLAF